MEAQLLIGCPTCGSQKPTFLTEILNVYDSETFELVEYYIVCPYCQNDIILDKSIENLFNQTPQATA